MVYVFDSEATHRSVNLVLGSAVHEGIAALYSDLATCATIRNSGGSVTWTARHPKQMGKTYRYYASPRPYRVVPRHYCAEVMLASIVV